MSDFKEQLAALRSSMPKAHPSSVPTIAPSVTAPKGVKAGKGRAQAQPLGDALLRKCLERLPTLGRIENFDVNRGFGFVPTAGGRSLFFHVLDEAATRRKRRFCRRVEVKM
jgi:hypothetical protein